MPKPATHTLLWSAQSKTYALLCPVSTPAYFCARIILTAHFSYSFQQLTISKVLSYLFCSSRRSMQPPHPTAGRLHLDPLWWTAGAETSAREIDRRASSSALVSSAKPTTG